MAKGVPVPAGARGAKGKPKPKPKPKPAAPMGPIPLGGYPMPDPEAAAARKARMDATRARKLSAMAKPKRQRAMRIGLGALAGIGAIAAGGGLVRQRLQKDRTEAALMDFYDSQRRDALAQQVEQVKRQSLERSIDQNLRNVAMFEPGIYTAVAAGRKLPQGAVVLGGEPRVDLLQELGRSMAEGQFRR